MELQQPILFVRELLGDLARVKIGVSISSMDQGTSLADICQWRMLVVCGSVNAESLEEAEQLAQSNPYIASIRIYEIRSK